MENSSGTQNETGFQQRISMLEQRHAELIAQNMQLQSSLAVSQGIQTEWEWSFENSLDMQCIAGLDGWFKKINTTFALTLGYSKQELLSRPFTDFIHPDDLEKTAASLHDLTSGIDIVDFENRYRHKDGRWRVFSWTTRAPGPGSICLYCIAHDVTEHKHDQKELLFRAEHDPLTGLVNRATFDKAVDLALGRARRNSRHQVGLLLLDLDGFKAINDIHGHPSGDLALKTVAIHLHSALRTIDVVCRLGGDEFAVLVEGSDPLMLEAIAMKIIDAVKLPITLEKTTVSIGCSCGGSTYPFPATDAKSLYQQADAAMYKVKKSGKNGYCRFEE